MRKTRTAFLGGLVALGVAAAIAMTLPGKVQSPLEHDAYIWQRSWRAPLIESIAANKDLVRSWRVLAAQVSPTGKLTPVAVQTKALEESGRPLVMVVRIDGQLPNFDQARLLDQVLNLYQRWRGQGMAIAGLEIDHDCGTAKLPAYAKLLALLRSRLDSGTQLSITALPAWIPSTHLADVLGAVDESVLQVHSVQKPQSGLFDPVQAGNWIAEYAKKSPTGFRVALPTYGSRIGFDDSGNVSFVESESALGRGMANSEELIVAPESVRQLIRAVDGNRPKNLRGYAWFRLPTDTDQRAWSIATWRTVVQGMPLTAAAHIAARPTSDPKLFDVVLQNLGHTDVSPPDRIRLAASCSDADGVGGYRAQTMEGRLWLVRQTPTLLRAQHEFAAGWARCEQDPSKELNGQS
ncbi:MAG: DUF3142 domain-containing protein [Propionivibrio sp.]|nr:DUF3142 domain-containing protein [Propionivibrio sp.]